MYKSKLPDDAAGVISGFSALAVPYGRGSLQTFGGPSVSSTEIFKVDSCGASSGFAWQRNLRSDSHTSFREHFSHNENCWIGQPVATEDTPPLLAILNRNDLAGFFRVAQTSKLRDPTAVASFRLGLCLRVSNLPLHAQ